MKKCIKKHRGENPENKIKCQKTENDVSNECYCNDLRIVDKKNVLISN